MSDNQFIRDVESVITTALRGIEAQTEFKPITVHLTRVFSLSDPKDSGTIKASVSVELKPISQ